LNYYKFTHKLVVTPKAKKNVVNTADLFPETVALPEKQNNGGRPQNNNKSDYDCLKAIAE